MYKGSLLRFLAILSVVGMFIVNLAGFLDTETHSALGCGREWPLCDGSVIPAKWGLHTLIEFVHRGLVGVVTLLFLVVAVWAWWKYGRYIEVRIFAGLAVGFIFLEALLGALGVLFADPPPLLASHFGIALIAFDAVTLLAVVLGQIQRQQRSLVGAGKAALVSRGLLTKGLPLRPVLPNLRLRFWVWFTVVYLYVAMYVGAFVAASGAGAMFRGWPFPTESYSQAGVFFLIDIAHRSFGLGLLLLTLWLVWLAHPLRSTRQDLYRAAWALVILVCAQAVSGGYLIWSHLSTPAFLIHVSIISIMFGTLGYLALQVSPEPRQRAAL
ncbi:heme A synthase [Alicyclobacillaceae bacterium I2511]|nr:heme A synthase [Alicyclobacillaceae bacterium I2511]